MIPAPILEGFGSRPDELSLCLLGLNFCCRRRIRLFSFLRALPRRPLVQRGTIIQVKCWCEAQNMAATMARESARACWER
jgi:hypothetical protein